MRLYHVTKLKLLPNIARDGLLPHVPGVVWNNSDPDVATLTGSKPVVWLTSDDSEWRHDTHSVNRNPEARLLTVCLAPNSKRLVRYAPWLFKLDPGFYEAFRKRHDVVDMLHGLPQGDIECWYVYFGTISPDKITSGLESERGVIAA